MEPDMQYLYEYKNGKRIRNIGFMKIENEMNGSKVHLYGKQMDDVVGICFRRENGETYVGTWGMEEVEAKVEVEEVAVKEKEEQEEVDIYIQSSNVTYEKIQRQDLSRLPRKEWRLANNSFLLHGFYNYHHLLYVEEDGDVWIGVPGIYHEKEKAAATAFGFPDFRRLVDVNIELQEEETNTYEDFGYWCRQIFIP